MSSSIYQPGLHTDQKKPENIIGENGLLEALTKAILERALDAELTRAGNAVSFSPARVITNRTIADDAP